ncbi:2-methyl-6-phytyl-1,4-hydroquinone methyltransferase, chloroplastic [Porphyridium purpureum]|uniref:2-methyl-6-phytyl-1,4-hydroquinone methyltransferase, chloroplastic n=1 Tax=Porphyridium purpureum TaxID=35688 RepID=A0A5J4YTX0_PORPP|nr:2-methyl-6-phytyl-1,4-hydroquinone methyltransferase, chloroplastic [Porphyridium purpureum]|eukprot:POR4352..scf229_5
MMLAQVGFVPTLYGGRQAEIHTSLCSSRRRARVAEVRARPAVRLLRATSGTAANVAIGVRSFPNEEVENLQPPERRKRRGMMQHKREAFWFYRWLSFFYDVVVNPFHWTREMRDEALLRAQLDSPCLRVVDVGGGTGFSTLGIVRYVAARYVVLMDQSAAQMSYAAQKRELSGVTFIEGDAENIPIRTNYADRYVSCGSIEYWPNPQQGIGEAYRILKPGGLACMVGPVRATNPLSRFFCDTWMLFPTEQEYIYWFAAAGFRNIKVSEITPAAYKGVRRHGLIMGLVVTGEKPLNGPDLPLTMEDRVYGALDDWEQTRSSALNLGQRIKFVLRQMLGTVAGFYYFVLPIAIMLYAALFIRRKPAAQ